MPSNETQWTWLQKIATIAYNMKGCLRFFFLLSYFKYRQIWLNIVMDDHHLNNTQNIVFLKKHKKIAPEKPKKLVFESSVLTSKWCGAKSTTKNEYVSFGQTTNRRRRRPWHKKVPAREEIDTHTTRTLTQSPHIIYRLHNCETASNWFGIESGNDAVGAAGMLACAELL